jgi:hypothetical protein
MKGLTLFIVGDELTEWGEKPNNYKVVLRERNLWVSIIVCSTE